MKGGNVATVDKVRIHLTTGHFLSLNGFQYIDSKVESRQIAN